MLQSFKKFWLPAIFTAVLTALIVLLIVHLQEKKIAVVDAVKLFNAYKMKMEMETHAGRQIEQLQHRADSLEKELALQGQAKDVDQKQREELYQALMLSRRSLEDYFRQSNQDINEQVWKRLNPAIDEYGKQKGLRLIIGANGMGSVLYNTDYYDHTPELIDFVNKKYEKGN